MIEKKAILKMGDHIAVTNENHEELYGQIFAPWVKDMGLTEITVSNGKASAVLPQKSALQFASGAICGQTIMAAIDTVVAHATNVVFCRPRVSPNAIA